MAVTPLATGRGAQVVTDPVSDARQAIRGAYANTLEENLAFIADSIAAGDLADGYTPDGTTLTGLDANNYVIANAPIAGGPGGTVDEAPTDGFTYGRRSTAWTLVVPSTGGAYTGPITLPGSPTLPQQATTKSYVDQAIANSQLNQGTWQVAANVPDLNAAIPTNLDGYTWTAQTVDPLVGEVAPAVPGISGRTINAGDTVRWNGTLATYELIQGAGLTQATADQRYVNVAGDTLTGPLVLAADPANPLEAATKQYVDDADLLLDAEKVNLAGDVMTGPLVLPGNPAAALQATPKQYVDTATSLKVSKSGDTMTGILVLSGDPVAALDAATRQYVDAGDAALDAAMVHRAGDAMSGPLTLSGPPTAPLHATSKAYVDAADAALDAAKVNLAGDTMTGVLVLQRDPQNSLEAATKAYVDTEVATANLYQGTWLVATNVPDLHVPPNAPLNGYSWVAVTADPNVAETAPAGIPGIGGTTIFNGDTIKWNDAAQVYDDIQGGSLTIAQADARFVQLTGDTMTGELELAADPVAALAAATRQYVDAGDALSVLRAGDTMTGELVVPDVKTDWIWPSGTGALAIRGDGITGPGQKRELDLYATYTDPATYVRAEFWVDGATQAVDIGGVRVNGAGYANYNVFVGPRGGGQLVLRAADTAWWSVMPTGQLYAVTDNTTDIGNAGAFRPRDVHVGRNARIDGTLDLLEQPATPATPTAGRMRLYPKASDGRFYTLDDTGLETILQGAGGGGLDQPTADLLYVSLVGGLKAVMTGFLTLSGTPTQLLHAATKEYVDISVASQNLYQGTWAVVTNVPDLRPIAMNPLNGWSWIAVTVDPNTPENADPSLPGIGGKQVYNGDTIRWNTGLGIYEQIQSSSLSVAQADQRYVNVTGDAMTGALVLASDPVAALQAATKSYVDTLAANAVQKAGDIMTGQLKLPVTPGPANPEDATTKQYVDQSIAATSLYQGAWQVAANTPDLTTATPLNGYSWIAQTVDPNVPEAAPAGLAGITAGTLIGAGTTLRWNGNTLQWELIQGGGLTQAVAGTLYVSKTGDTMTGSLTMSADGTGLFTNGGGAFYKAAGTGLIIRQHVNNTQPQIENNDGTNRRAILDAISGDARYVNKAGDTMTGGLIWQTAQAANPGDNSKHIQFYSSAPTIGINVTSGRINYNHNAAGDTHWFRSGNADRFGISSTISIPTPIGTNVLVQLSNSTLTLKNTNTTPNPYSAGFVDVQTTRGTCARFTGTAAISGNNDCKAQIWNNNGGWGWQSGFEMQTNSPPTGYFGNVCSANSFTTRSSRENKEDIRYVEPGDIAHVFDKLKLVRYRMRDRPWPVDENGERLPECPPQPEEWKRQRIGLIVEDLKADPELGGMVFGEGEEAGYDMAQMLALAMAQIKVLTAEVAALKARA